MIRCARCNVKKHPKCFSVNKGKRRKTCKPCIAKQIRAYYARSPEYRKAQKALHRRKVLEGQKRVNDYLKFHPCVDCGEINPIVLEFDHLKKSKKNRDVTSLARMAWKSVLKEIAKCEVVCANCHTIRTARRANTLRWKLNRYE
jgi:hypothetical protein